MVRTIEHCPHEIVKECEKCCISWLVSNTKEGMKKAGWRKKWFWSRLRKIWHCPLCVADADILSWRFALRLK